VGETWAFCHGPKAGFGGPVIQPKRMQRRLGEGPRKPTATRWAEKSPANVFYFQEILAHFDDVRLIHLIRDGRDVVTSMHPKRDDRPWVSPRRWVEAVTTGLAVDSDPRVLAVRYEDLVADCEKTMRRILDHVGERPTHEMRNWLEHSTIKRSGNLQGGAIMPVSMGSVRKFKQPGFKGQRYVEDLMRRSDAVSLLDRLGYLKPASMQE
jgi:hypothetical protein